MIKNSDDLNSITICDFGTAIEIDTIDKSQCGTTLYMAPEMIESRPYDQLVDLWACGIILYVLTSGGRHPIYNPKMNTSEYTKEFLQKNQWNFPDQLPL